MKYVVITGMSGAGKSTALHILEDMGYFCVDNLPLPLMEKFMELSEGGDKRYEKIAMGLDIRSGGTPGEIAKGVELFKQEGADIKILYLDASDEVLIKRYKETRRTHPLSGDGRVESGIEMEREQTRALRSMADYIIDTSLLLTRELNEALCGIFLMDREYSNIFITVLSFGFKYGIPPDADLVFDVRFLPNPFYVESLRAMTGSDAPVRDYVMQSPDAQVFLDKLEDMIRFLIPRYVSEGKNRLVIAIGCTGGKHRSVTITNALYERLSESGDHGLRKEHRDIDKDAKRGK